MRKGLWKSSAAHPSHTTTVLLHAGDALIYFLGGKHLILREGVSRGLTPCPTWQVLLVGGEAVGDDEVPGQAERGHLQNQGLVPVLHQFGDNVEGAEGRNSDALEMAEKRKKNG